MRTKPAFGKSNTITIKPYPMKKRDYRANRFNTPVAFSAYGPVRR
jgi:hypothetical protein